ncbi:TolC family outer membrane protein [Thauera sp.]|uniref:TolC family outer membrane protein n=1 Tax=Thauera sp. TaxID=1905334 RepID=UPI002A36E62A|nr:TolC family outer membrane protein [Thauera sp.]MDX9886574.1 TolC family outer membrane protein [Thauera sp.]
MTLKNLRLGIMFVVSVMPMTALAEIPEQLRDAARKAVVSNPEVQARWNAFLASDAAQDVARGGYYPQVQLSGGVGRESTRSPAGVTERFSTRGAQVSLSQVVYDGFYTSSEVERFAYQRLGSYYALLEASESAASEAIRAYADVLRYGRLVDLAKQNYVEHKVVHDQIAERTAAGVGRRVDLEQASGRLALAESNLLTEVTNLHDVSARYQRIVGELPEGKLADLPASMAGEFMPKSAVELLREGFNASPSLNAAVESVRAGQAQLSAWRSAHHPRLDLRARQSLNHNLDGASGNTRESVVELVLTYNLFRGGSDQARIRQAADELNVAKDLREKACRDVRQNLTIAFNETARLGEQLGYLDQHQLSIEKAREAYRRQFDIGQRTLLDLLDAENEYFQARRAYVIAVYDKATAETRTLAGMGRLMQALGVARDDLPKLAELERSREQIDVADLCPTDAPAFVEIDKDALFAEAMREAGK